MKDFKFMPFGRKVLVEQTGKMSLTSGLIVQAETVNAPVFGVVIEVGDGDWANGVFMPTRIKKGDNVMFFEGQGGDVKSHGKDLILLNEDSIVGTYDSTTA